MPCLMVEGGDLYCTEWVFRANAACEAARTLKLGRGRVVDETRTVAAHMTVSGMRAWAFYTMRQAPGPQSDGQVMAMVAVSQSPRVEVGLFPAKRCAIAHLQGSGLASIPSHPSPPLFRNRTAPLPSPPPRRPCAPSPPRPLCSPCQLSTVPSAAPLPLRARTGPSPPPPPPKPHFIAPVSIVHLPSPSVYPDSPICRRHHSGSSAPLAPTLLRIPSRLASSPARCSACRFGPLSVLSNRL